MLENELLTVHPISLVSLKEVCTRAVPGVHTLFGTTTCTFSACLNNQQLIFYKQLGLYLYSFLRYKMCGRTPEPDV